MPLTCPLVILPYDACSGCRQLHNKECWANPLVPLKLSGILTLEERVAILEDRPEPPMTQSEWTGNQWDYVQQLKGQVVFLTNKVNELLARKPKTEAF